MKTYVVAGLVAAVLGAGVALLVTSRTVEPRVAAQEQPLPQQPLPPEAELARQDEYTPEERVNINVYEKVNRSVVNITTRIPRAELFFAMEPAEGAGSGSVLDPDGHILTNYHVIEGAQEVRVTLFNGESYDAGLMGADPVFDIAVLRINAPRQILFPVDFGDSSVLKVGQKVFAIGNPFGLERTMTVGIISSLNRSLPARSGRTMKSIIQIDAALNQGNSGGPLLDSHGRLIGMNTAIASPTGANTGVGFAIPINNIRRVVPQLIEKGRVVRPDIGITRVYQTEQGLVIATMAEGGPAERARLTRFPGGQATEATWAVRLRGSQDRSQLRGHDRGGRWAARANRRGFAVGAGAPPSG